MPRQQRQRLPATAEAAADMPEDKVIAVKPTRVALVEVPSTASAVPTLAVSASVELLLSAPHRPSGIVICSVSILSFAIPSLITLDL
ncbi:uncharacterized protein Pyn_30515 [Prunus yedoensis var. nudiflora]|uniref:Uncharacterized protein n=1 Tax=Prunus yedoensis var. nudiflora TaxID=2094558 RepID=A0A314XWG0_PRUYE|nr:uncharacterized protein Pyn_30515 [Prunus yedoensis var. nudiflora]